MRNLVKQDFQLVNSKYKLSTGELKFIMTAIAQIKMEDEEFAEYEIKVSELEQKLQVKKNETHLKVFAKKLMSKVLEVPTEDGWILFNWFSKIHYVRGQAKFIVRIDNDLRPYLLQLQERFVKYNLQYILPLTGNYSIRIYQLLKEYQKIQKRTFTVTELQELLQIPKSYKANYGIFKKKVLHVAQRELKEHCDIYFEFDEIKIGKKVNEIVFKIKSNIKETKINTPQLFDVELSEQQEILQQYIGKKLEKKHKIISFNIVENLIIVTTEIGDYRFLNIDTFLENVS